jgi:hypothetical protein
MGLKKIKISELPITQNVIGFFTIGVDALNRSVKFSLEKLQSDWTQAIPTALDFIKNKPGNATHAEDGFMSKEDKVKLDGIEEGAEVNVQSDWTETDNTQDDFIKNKPVNVTQIKDGFMSKEDKVKLDGIEEGAEVNVQSDWNQTDNTQDDFIKNKPSFKTIFAQSIIGEGDINPQLVEDITYDGSTGDITVKFSDGTADKVINIPADNFLSTASYDGDTNILTLTLSNGETVEVEIGSMLHEYLAAEGGGLEVVNGNEFKIEDNLYSIITRTPIQREALILAANWTGSGDLWSYVVEDNDVIDGCIFEAWPADRASKMIALHAEMDENIIVIDESFTLTCANRPHSDFNIIYTMMI